MTALTQVPQKTTPDDRGGIWSFILTRQSFWISTAAIIATALLSVTTNTFATPQNLFNVTRNLSFVGIVALGMTAVIVTGGIDLSVGSTIGLSGIVLSLVMHAGWSIWFGMGAALLAAAAIGLINGLLVAYTRIPPFVVTLGMLSAARSLSMIISNNQTIFSFGPDENWLLWIGGGALPLGHVANAIPNPLIFTIVLALLFGFAFHFTQWGRHIFAVGGNEHAARLTGVPVQRIKVSVYVVCALTAGISAILEVGWLGAVTTGLGEQAELSVIAAAVIGGANLMGGIGSAFGAVVGAALLEIIRNSLLLIGISAFWQGIFIAAAILLAAGLEGLRGFEQWPGHKKVREKATVE